ncbi:MAG: L-lactate dehydrogenase [Lentisphaerae bacterium]|nr:L-lactate dehydrogenase [Lentisphaerota bacterium]
MEAVNTKPATTETDSEQNPAARDLPRSRKVVIVGAGAVGSTFAYALAQDGGPDEIVLYDTQRDLAQGQILDLAHGLPFMPPMTLRAGGPDDYADARVIVITAGAKQKSGESRLDLLQRNAAIMRQIMDDVTDRDSQAVVVVVANPVDLLTRVALERSDWPRNRIMGSGTVLDTARFRYLLSRHCGVDSRNVHAYILGEHGDSEIAPWSLTHIAGVSMETYCAVCGKHGEWDRVKQEIVEEVRQSAYHIIDYKGATNYAIGLALVQIVRAIIRNQHSVLTVSALLNGEFGLRDVCLSVPCMLSEKGIERVLHGELAPKEQEGLQQSARVLREAWNRLRSELRH